MAVIELAGPRAAAERLGGDDSTEPAFLHDVHGTADARPPVELVEWLQSYRSSSKIIV